MSTITRVVIGSDNFSNETYIHGFFATTEEADKAISEIPPNGTLPDTFQIMTLDQARRIYKNEGDEWYFDKMLENAQKPKPVMQDIYFDPPESPIQRILTVGGDVAIQRIEWDVEAGPLDLGHLNPS